MRQRGRTHEHREKERLRAKANYEKHREEGVCTRCGKGTPENGKVSCEPCLKFLRTGRQMGVGTYRNYPPGCFLERLMSLSGLTIAAIVTTTDIPLHRVYQWRSRKPTPQEALILKEKLLTNHE